MVFFDAHPGNRRIASWHHWTGSWLGRLGERVAAHRNAAETMPVSRLLASPQEVGVDPDALEELFAAGQREVDEGRAQGN